MGWRQPQAQVVGQIELLCNDQGTSVWEKEKHSGDGGFSILNVAAYI